MPMTIRQILDKSFPSVASASKFVVLKEDSSLVPSFRRVPSNPKLNGAPKLVATMYSTADAHGAAKKGRSRRYKAVIAGMDKDKKLSEGPVMVACECDYFTFTCEVALAKRGAAKITNSNGQPPTVTNPKMVPTACKHLYKLLTLAQKRRL